MLAVTEPGVHVITAMVATQLLKTSLLENIVGYHAHLDPCPMLLVQPKEDAAEQFSRERIAPFIKATPVLKDLIGSANTRTSDDTLLYKSFAGGFLGLVGAGSPDNLARRPVRIVCYDEIDKYPITKEGDPISLGDERMATFVNWLSIRACSPTIEDESRIEKSYLDSDQRRASLACPHCAHRQFPTFFSHVEWGEAWKSAAVKCEACGTLWSEADRLIALRTIQWHQTKPFDCCGHRHEPLKLYATAWQAEDEAPLRKVWDWWSSDLWAVYRAKCPECGAWGVSNEHAGFQAGKLFSPWPKDSPARIAKKYLDAKNDEDLKQVWWNTQEGMPYRPHSGKDIKAEALASRGETWAGQVPWGAAVVTVGMDVQDWRVELERVAWGRNEESWSIEYEVIDGEFDDPKVQAAIDAYLKKQSYRSDGRPFEVMAACIDSGGHHTQAVYDFAKSRLGRHVWAIKGESARTGQRNPVWPVKRPTSRTKKAFRPIIIGVNAAKDTIRSRLKLEEPGPGYMHFPADRDVNYFAQITSERIVVKESSGQKYRVWELPSGRANEALDCRVYAYAALCGLLHFGLKLNRRVDEVSPPIKQVSAEAARALAGQGTPIDPALPDVQRPPPEPMPRITTPGAVRIIQKAPEAPQDPTQAPPAKKSRSSRLA